MSHAVTEVSICNIALRELHATKITSLSEASLEATTCALYYEIARNFVLVAAPWNFAIKRTGVQAELGTAPQWGYSKAYSYPSDCLRLLEINNEDSGWRVELNADNIKTIVTDLSNPKLRYIKEIEDPQQFSSSFVFALAKFLKHLLAIPLTGQQEKSDKALQEYQGFLTQAKTDDGQESSQVIFASGALESVR